MDTDMKRSTKTCKEENNQMWNFQLRIDPYNLLYRLTFLFTLCFFKKYMDGCKYALSLF